MKNNSKNIPLLFVLGILLLAYGFGVFYVKQYITQLTAVCILIGAANILICVIRIRSLSPKFSSRSRWKKVALFSALIVLWVVLYVEVNYLAYHSNIR